MTNQEDCEECRSSYVQTNQQTNKLTNQGTNEPTNKIELTNQQTNKYKWEIQIEKKHMDFGQPKQQCTPAGFWNLTYISKKVIKQDSGRYSQAKLIILVGAAGAIIVVIVTTTTTRQ